MPGTGTEAYEAMVSHHRTLGEQLAKRVSAIATAAATGQPQDTAVAGLVAYLAGEILPHAAAEEETIYPAARDLDGLAGTVAGMIAEHRELSEAAGRLAASADAAEVAGRAERIAGLFTEHVAKENDILLPALLASEGTDLPELLAGMQAHTRQAAHGDAAAAEPAADPQATVLSLLLQATTELARAGQGDRACRLTAAAWAALRESRPDLAVRLTAALHGLARRAGTAPAAAGHQHSSEATGRPAAITGGPGLDVRSMPPAQRHESIFAAYRSLAPGTGFLLINDHDPKPLRYQFEAEHAGEFTWDYLEEGPRTWRVRIGRPVAATPARGGQAGEAAAGAGDEAAEPDLDVRQLPHWQRHDTIFTAYRALAPGRGVVLVTNHDPVPLRYQFEAQYAGDFTWDYLETGPETWRVRIGRIR